MNTLIAGLYGTVGSSTARILPVAVDSAGALSVATAPPAAATNSATTATVASKQIAAAAKTLTGLAIFNTGATDVYVQLHDSATTPSESTATSLCILALAGMLVTWPLPAGGRRFTNGIYLCASSTAATKTIDAAATLMVDAQLV